MRQHSPSQPLPHALEDPPKGILLEDLTWLEAEKVLTATSVVVIPLGAAAKEHGPHLKLKNDWVLAEYFKQRVLEAAEVVIAPTVAYSFYPAFLEYSGSTSLRLETARDTIIDIATRDKGEQVVEAVVAGVLRELEDFARAPLP